jgi:hypothetical protein
MPAETVIQLRHGTAVAWAASNGGLGSILASGELGLDTTNGLLKVGDGAKAWNDTSLKYLTDVSNLVGGTLPTTITSGPALRVLSAVKLTTPITVNGTTGVDWSSSSYTFTAAAGTLTGDTLNSTVTKSSLTKVGPLSSGTAGFVKVDASGNLSSDSNTYARVSGDTLNSFITKSSIQYVTVPTGFSTLKPMLRIDSGTGQLFRDDNSYLKAENGYAEGILTINPIGGVGAALVLEGSSYNVYEPGQLQNSGGSLYFDGDEEGTGAVPSISAIYASQNKALSNVTTAQNVFGKSLPLSDVDFYQFDILLFIRTGTNTSRTMTFSIPGMNSTNVGDDSVTYGGPRMSILTYLGSTASTTAGATISAADSSSVVATSNVKTSTSIAIIPASTFYEAAIRIQGTYKSGSGDTFNPTISFGTAGPGSGAYLAAGSYAKIWKTTLPNGPIGMDWIGNWG